MNAATSTRTASDVAHGAHAHGGCGCAARAAAQTLGAHEVIYGVLAELLADPRILDAEAFVASAAGTGLTDLAAPLAGPIGAALDALARAGCAASAEEVREQADVVLSSILSAELPPYSARYSEGVAFREQEDLADIAGFYRAFGVDVSPNAHERPDHVRVELEFLALLCHRARSAREAGELEKAEVTDDAMRRFLRDYVGACLFTLAEGLHAHGAPPIYEAWGAVLRELLVLEYARLGLTLPEPVRAKLPVPGEDCGPMACLGEEMS